MTRNITSRLLSCLGAAALLLASPVTHAADADARVWQIRPSLDRLPPALDGLLVQLQQTASPRIAVHNLTGDTLEILDHGDQPFLRIGPHETTANLASSAFHRSRYAEDRPPPASAAGEPRWQRVDNGPAWAWFDSRLQVDGMTVPTLREYEDEVLVQRWAIPVRFRGEEHIISGYFLYRDAPNGLYRTRLASDQAPAADVSVYPLAGLVPGVFIANRGNASFTVLGIEGEPFVRYIPGKVLVNRRSPTWRIAAPSDSPIGHEDSGGDGAKWAVASTTGGFGWRDPRAFHKGDPPADRSKPGVVGEWSIPVDVEGERTEIRGSTEWLPGHDG
ncbi:hypothetical protein RM531_11465 [Salinisphaera sp. P385]|uniref:Uncharacterized protein n=1 Tax=Spectribacter acetivorans TaxID=3075603 RepID=A0ABU3BCW3_9GAMM|nr:hypothetical protein [Salinisphaera sp. P385]MDT0619093.1 hypothetical protein [Salinisphaera sp. P385]